MPPTKTDKPADKPTMGDKPETGEVQLLRDQVARLQEQLAQQQQGEIESLRRELAELQGTVKAQSKKQEQLEVQQDEYRRLIEKSMKESQKIAADKMQAHFDLAQGDKKYFVTLKGQGRAVGRIVGVHEAHDGANATAKYMAAVGATKTLNDTVCEPYDHDVHWPQVWHEQKTALETLSQAA